MHGETKRCIQRTNTSLQLSLLNCINTVLREKYLFFPKGFLKEVNVYYLFIDVKN